MDIKNVFFTPEKMYIINNKNEQIKSFTRNEKNIRFVIEAEIKENNPLMNFGVSIINSSNQVIFTTWVRDTKINFKQGKNKFIFTIPNNLMNIGKYKAMLFAGIHQVSYIIYPGEQPLIYFDVHGTIGTNFGDDIREGCIVPILEWSNIQ